MKTALICELSGQDGAYIAKLNVEAMSWIPQHLKADDFVIATGSAYRLADLVAATFAEMGLSWRVHVHLNENLQRRSEIICSEGDAGEASADLGGKCSSPCLSGPDDGAGRAYDVHKAS